MRGLCLNGLLARMGSTRGGVYAAIILSSLMFGFLHFNPLIDFGDQLQVAQNFMKVLQAGMCGFLFAAILVKTRNIWTVAIIHGADDFMLLFISSGLVGTELTTEYVSTGEEGIAILVVYSVLILLYLPFIFVGKKLIDQASPWRGDFYRYTETNPTTTRVNEPISYAAPTPARYPSPASTPVLAPIAEHPTQPMQAAPTTIDAATAKALRGKHARIPATSASTEGTPYGQDL